MQIPVKVQRKESGLEEWTIIELQGALEIGGSHIEGSHVGDLSYADDGVPVLVIGHHALFGKEATLDKPYAVMVKSQGNDGLSYAITALIKHKLVFKSRPKPIVTQNLKS